MLPAGCVVQEKLDDYPEDEIYFIIDCPGQIELYTHLRPINVVLEEFKSREYACCSLCLVDSTFVTETPKFISVSHPLGAFHLIGLYRLYFDTKSTTLCVGEHDDVGHDGAA